MPYTYK